MQNRKFRCKIKGEFIVFIAESANVFTQNYYVSLHGTANSPLVTNFQPFSDFPQLAVFPQFTNFQPFHEAEEMRLGKIHAAPSFLLSLKIISFKIVFPFEIMESDSELWYAEGLLFECQECGTCCTGAPGYVWLSEEEIARIAARLELSVEEFEQHFVKDVGERKSLIEYLNGDCVFFDSFHRNCKIYTDRPAQCRTWPFWDSNLESNAAWEKISRGCKGCNQGKLFTLEEILERKNIREL